MDGYVSFSAVLRTDISGWKLAKPFEDGEDLDDLRADPVDDPVVALDDLANAGPRKLGHRPAHLGKLAQSLAALDETVDETLGRIGVGAFNEMLVQPETMSEPST